MQSPQQSHDNLIIFGEHDGATVKQMETCLESGAERGVLCADGHKGYAQPIGGVVAYKDKISISGVGFDIACGNLAIRTNIQASAIACDMEMILKEISMKISFGVGRVNQNPIDHEIFNGSHDGWQVDCVKELMPLARQQLGTVGSGNHYVDIFKDESGIVWVGVHFGSRGFGHRIASAFLERAGGKDGMDVPPTVVNLADQIGQDYYAAMYLAGLYAYAGREYVANVVVSEILKGKCLESIHNHHNFAWREPHNGETLWVVRKGATPAFPGQKGFVGGSMGDDAVILEGVDSELSKQSLYSTVHGAGRIMSRTAAKGKFEKVGGKKIRMPGLVRHDEMHQWLKDKGICLLGGDLDEAPQAYRRLPEVLKAHEGTIKILHRLTPMGVVMAGRDVIDPYKD